MARGWADNPIFMNEAYSRRDAWIWMIERACWKPTKFNVKGKTITLERGQFCASIRQMADQFQWSIGAVQRFCTRLQTDTLIDTQIDTGKTIVTICNYSKYQDVDKVSDTQSDTQSDTEAIRKRYTNKQGNKETIELNTDYIGVLTRETRKKTKPKTEPFTPPDWVPIDAWDGFVAMRKLKDGGLTERGLVLAINKLDKLRGDGHDPGDVLDQSTLAKWAGLFEIRKNRNNGHAGQSNFNQGLRGSRPDPALDMLRQARADRDFESQGSVADTRDSGFDWAAIPTIGSS